MVDYQAEVAAFKARQASAALKARKKELMAELARLCASDPRDDATLAQAMAANFQQELVKARS